MQFIGMQKLIINILEITIKNKKSSYLDYWDVNNLYGWAMSQKLPVNNFEWIEETFQFNEDFIKKYNEESDEGYFLKSDLQYPEKMYELYNDLPFLPNKKKKKMPKSLLLIYMMKMKIYTHNKFKIGIKSWISFKKSL